MFGYVSASGGLTKEDRAVYRAYYCGLCKSLGRLTQGARLTLNFDMTFLYLFLSAYFGYPEENERIFCALHPLKKQNAYVNEYAEYASCMNILLTYYKLQDDREDDGSVIAGLGMNVLKPAFLTAKKLYPQKAARLEEHLLRLKEMEERDEHNCDLPASVFGDILGEMFDINGDDERLRQFGYLLGKAVYVMDACCDLKDDIKRMRYNPLVESSAKNFQQILTVLLSDCTQYYDTMGIEKNKGIIEDVLYSGIWAVLERKIKNGSV